MFVLLFLYCFVFVFIYAFVEAVALHSIVLRYACASTAKRLNCYVTTIVCVLFFSVEMSFLPSIFVPLPFPRCIEGTSYIFPIRMVFFYLVTTEGLDI